MDHTPEYEDSRYTKGQVGRTLYLQRRSEYSGYPESEIPSLVLATRFWDADKYEPVALDDVAYPPVPRAGNENETPDSRNSQNSRNLEDSDEYLFQNRPPLATSVQPTSTSTKYRRETQLTPGVSGERDNRNHADDDREPDNSRKINSSPKTSKLDRSYGAMFDQIDPRACAGPPRIMVPSAGTALRVAPNMSSEVRGQSRMEGRQRKTATNNNAVGSRGTIRSGNEGNQEPKYDRSPSTTASTSRADNRTREKLAARPKQFTTGPPRSSEAQLRDSATTDTLAGLREDTAAYRNAGIVSRESRNLLTDRTSATARALPATTASTRGSTDQSPSSSTLTGNSTTLYTSTNEPVRGVYQQPSRLRECTFNPPSRQHERTSTTSGSSRGSNDRSPSSSALTGNSAASYTSTSEPARGPHQQPSHQRERTSVTSGSSRSSMSFTAVTSREARLSSTVQERPDADRSQTISGDEKDDKLRRACEDNIRRTSAEFARLRKEGWSPRSATDIMVHAMLPIGIDRLIAYDQVDTRVEMSELLANGSSWHDAMAELAQRLVLKGSTVDCAAKAILKALA